MLVSVVMPSFNQALYISQAIDSVLNQSYRSIELVVMDGGSTDNTTEILQEKQRVDKRLRWWSERDNGPAHAINKALAKTKGTIIGWLNSDDLYTPRAIELAVACLSESANSLLCYGDGCHIDEEGKHLSDYPTIPHRHDVSHTPPNFHAFSEHCFLCQPAVFFKRSLYSLQGGLDENYNASFDFEFWLRAFKNFQGRITYIPEVLAYSRLHNDCITQNQRSIVAIEGMDLLSKHRIAIPAKWAISYFEESTSDNVDIDNPDAHEVLNKANTALSEREKLKLSAYMKKRKFR